MKDKKKKKKLHFKYLLKAKTYLKRYPTSMSLRQSYCTYILSKAKSSAKPSLVIFCWWYYYSQCSGRLCCTQENSVFQVLTCNSSRVVNRIVACHAPNWAVIFKPVNDPQSFPYNMTSVGCYSQVIRRRVNICNCRSVWHQPCSLLYTLIKSLSVCLYVCMYPPTLHLSLSVRAGFLPCPRRAAVRASWPPLL